jgi:subtilisin family serine protease
MAEKKRYTITLKDKGLTHEAFADHLGLAQRRMKDACETLLTAKVVRSDDVMSFPEIGVLSAALTKDEAEECRNRDAVLQVMPVRKVGSRSVKPTPDDLSLRASAAPSAEEAREPLPWNIRMVKADQVWGRVTGAGVKVGIIDSGIDKRHPDLTVAEGVSFYPGIDDWDDVEDGHGTFCAGIVGARKNDLGVVGVAPDCSLYAIKVSYREESNTDYLLAGMTWAARKKLDVVSISLWDTSGAEQPYEEPWEDMTRGAQHLIDNGCVVVGIAGNSGYLIDRHWVTNPGRCPRIIAVGGVDRAKERWVTSSYGPDDLPEEQGVELVAPGMGIRSTYRGGGYKDGESGTSFACPHVTGAVALLKQLHPTWTPAEIRARLKQTSEELGPAGRDAEYGVGLLDCYRAVLDPVH